MLSASSGGVAIFPRLYSALIKTPALAETLTKEYRILLRVHALLRDPFHSSCCALCRTSYRLQTIWLAEAMHLQMETLSAGEDKRISPASEELRYSTLLGSL